jgi:uncharacterized protein with NAD-binding domain and iron-sulfur cluster
MPISGINRNTSTLPASFSATKSRSGNARCSFIVRSQDGASQKKVIVVGGGWAGFGAAKALSEQGYAVKILDAAPAPGGVSAGWRTPSGRPVEAGTKGFWYEYPNIFSLLRQLDMPEWPLGKFETSGFWGPTGDLITEAPVFSEQPQLPALIGQFVYTHPLFYGLPLIDRLSILPWLFNVINLRASGETYERYDNMSAYELFRLFGVTDKAYKLFLKPTLAVGLFAPPEQLSAASVLETLEFYALAHQNSFDVCWAKRSISECIFEPLIEKIEASGGELKGGRLVSGIDVDPSSGAVTSVVAINKETGNEEVYETDAVVLAISITGMQKLVSSTPELGSRLEFQKIMNLSTIDCIATRIWFDRKIPTRFPANVLADFEPDVGCTYFNLSQMQPDEFKNDPGTVIAADFYGASSLLPLSDAEILEKVQKNIALCEPAFASAEIIDSAVLRFPKAVTHFSPGSFKNRPYQQTSFPNVMLAGDYIKGLDHGANGLSQERAYVTGLAAANLVMQQLGQGAPAEILPVEADEGHIRAAKQVNKSVVNVLNSVGIRLPFL